MVFSSVAAILAHRHILFGIQSFSGRAPVGERAPTNDRLSLPNHHPAAIPPPVQQPPPAIFDFCELYGTVKPSNTV